MTKNNKKIATRSAPSSAAMELARGTDTGTLFLCAAGRIGDADAHQAACFVLHERGETLASMIAALDAITPR